MWNNRTAYDMAVRNGCRIETETVPDKVDRETGEILSMRARTTVTTPDQVGIKTNGALDFLTNHLGFVREG